MAVLRRGTDADYDEIARMHVRSWQVGYAGIVPAGYLDSLDPAVFAERRRSWPKSPGTGLIVALGEAGEIVGFVNYGPARAEERDDQGEIYAIYVDPPRWGTGAGRELMAAAKDALRAQGRAELRLWVLEENDRARRFYEAAGLLPDGERDTWSPWGSAHELPEIRYRGRL